MSLDDIMRSKYTSLGCALLNSYFAINCVISGSWGWFIVCSLLGIYCFKNFLESR